MTLRVALASTNPIVGDLAGNAEKVRRFTAAAVQDGAELVIFGEMVLTGYPVEDLALRKDFQLASRKALDQLAHDLAADGCAAATVIVGFLGSETTSQKQLKTPFGTGYPSGGPRNSAAVIHDGRVTATYDKFFLPNYGVFDEARYFIPGTGPTLVTVNSHVVCLAICEDLWREGGPVEWARAANADVLAVLNASPYERGKEGVRLELCQRRAQQSGATVLYTNIVGGQDELVFDGGSMAISPGGHLIAQGQQFEESVLHLEISGQETNGQETNGQEKHNLEKDNCDHRSAPVATLRLSPQAEVWAALSLSLRDYVHKNGFQSVVLGVSGGIDSALVGALAVDSLGSDRVHGVAMPSQFSSQHSLDDAYALAMRTGLSIRTIPIQPMFDSYLSNMKLSGLAEENLQARIRGATLMALSNSEGHLVLATGNKSELSVGYSTIYGDAVGGFAPIKDIPKTLVWELARWRNESAEKNGETPPIPPNSISKEPSAELRPDQLDTDSLPNYDVLDAILDSYVQHDDSADELIARGFDAELVHRVIRLTDAAEYKRRQFPPGTKITLKSFGRDRRLPITNHWRA